MHSLRNEVFVLGSILSSIQELIASEDPRSPLTDREIADRLSVSRTRVTLARKGAGIPDSRERLRPALASAVKRLMSDGDMSVRELTRSLEEEGYAISRFTVEQLRRQVGSAGKAPPRQAARGAAGGGSLGAVAGRKRPVDVSARRRESLDQSDPFARLLGGQGSLKPLIQQAKAAVLYPPNGLHTLILGPAGVGKNELAEAMYRFALEVRGRGDRLPFVTFNCADYAENPQLLLSQLFGHVRGAYTGAETDKVGLVEQANGGMIFLDEIHRLPAEGQEILFHLMDRGRFRRLGETGSDRYANVTLIAATTENPESSLLVTFRRRIPMVIEMPSLVDRPLAERLEMIQRFFREEAARTGTAIRVLKEASQAFLLYDCPGNVGQLKSDIQVACARGFLIHVSEATKEVEIDASKLPNHVRRGLLKLPGRRQEIDGLVPGDLVILPEKEIQVAAKEDLYTLPGEIYQYIEQRYDEMRKAGLADLEINRLLGSELEAQFRQHLKRVKPQPQAVAREDLIRIVGRDMVETVETMLNLTRSQTLQMDQHLFYCLAIHLSAAVERLRQGKSIVNPHLEEVKKEYVREYRMASEMISYVEKRLGMAFPEDETGFLAMYLHGSLTKGSETGEGRVGVVVMTHGKVASGMIDVAARLLGSSHARWVEMSLDEDPETVLERATATVRDADEGKGALLLVDMGSLLTFGEIITERTGIPTRTVDRVDTIMVVEAIRRAALPNTSIDELAENLTGWRGSLARAGAPGPGATAADGARKTIVTVCLTGEGTARRLKDLLEKIVGKDEIEVVPVGASGRVDVGRRIRELARDRRIVAVVGSVDPGYGDAPFIPVEEIIGGGGAGLVRGMLNKSGDSLVEEVLSDELLVPKATWSTREEAIDGLANLMISRGYVTGAFLTDVYRRELSSPTMLEGEVAIPHGDPAHVLRPAIAVASLAQPVQWAGGKVSLVCLLALNSMSKKTFDQVYRVLRPGPHLERLKAAGTREEMRDAVLAGMGLPERCADSTMTVFSELVSPELVVIGMKAGSKEEVLDRLASLLTEHGAVKPSYSGAVQERERKYPTGLPTQGVGVAIPHADPEHVLKPAIALATLASPVSFGLMGDASSSVEVGLVLMLALKDANGQLKTLQKLVEAFQVPGLLAGLRDQKDAAGATEVLRACLVGADGRR
ncbi:MAG: PTS sugar transporter subunit IIA [Ignavibacteriales bacterium]